MKFFVTANGSVSWQHTRATALASTHFRTGRADYGIGDENEALCPGCGRTLPTVCMHLDHILSQARFTPTMLGHGVVAEIMDNVRHDDESALFRAEVVGGVVSIYTVGTPSKRARRAGMAPPRGDLKATAHTAVAWENDLCNLQFLCMACNTAKGDRDFDQHFPGRVTRPFLT